MRIPTLVIATLLIPLSTTFAGGPCGDASIGPYGSGCNPVGFDVPAYKGAFDPGGCSIALGFSGAKGCCNTFLTARIVFIGFAQANAPVPQVGPGCTLLVQPQLAFVLPPDVTEAKVALPPLPAGVTFVVYSQYLNQYTTFGVQNDYNMSNGLAIKMAG